MCGPDDEGWCSYCNTTETFHRPDCPLADKKEQEKKKHLENIAILNQHVREK